MSAKGFYRTVLSGVIVGVTVLAFSSASQAFSLSKPKKHNNTSPNAIANPLPIDAQEKDKYWLTAKEYVYKSVPQLLAQHQAEMKAGIRDDKLMQGNVNSKEIALTFDDGPHPGYTNKILAILKKYNIKATFFLVGEMAEKYPDLVKAEVRAGHSVGNHTYHHVSLNRIPPGYVATELKSCNIVLNSILKEPVHLFRPPGGDYDTAVAETADALNLKMILWTDDPGDYASPGINKIVSRTLAKADNGGIILIHDGVQQTVDALPQVITKLKAQGYTFVTIDQMLNHKQ